MGKTERYIPYWERKRKITKRQKAVLELKVRNYSAEEIANMLNIKVATVYVTVHRAKGRVESV